MLFASMMEIPRFHKNRALHTEQHFVSSTLTVRNILRMCTHSLTPDLCFVPLTSAAACSAWTDDSIFVERQDGNT